MVIIKEFVFHNEGQDCYSYTLSNNTGLSIVLMEYGASILDIRMPDKDGIVESVLATLKDPKEFVNHKNYYGMTVGRTAGRIKNGSLNILGKQYQMEVNNKPNGIHGGKNGLSYRIYNTKIVEEDSLIRVEFSTIIKDMDDGCPGSLEVKVLYTLHNNELKIDYYAKSDKDTVCNITNHAYFNLSGNKKETILQHHLMINSNRFVLLDQELLPIGIKDVNNTPMDFRKPKEIGKDIEDGFLQNHNTKGIDHPFILSSKGIDMNQVELIDPVSKRKLTARTTYPAIVIYTYNYPDNENLIGGIANKYDGICFECQYIPNGINDNTFDDSILLKDEVFNQQTIFKFELL